MKKVVVGFAVLLLFAVTVETTLAQAQPVCPEGTYLNPITKKCDVPGEDSSGATEWELWRNLIEEGQAYCKNGWCCVDKLRYERCISSGHREQEGQCLGCIRYK